MTQRILPIADLSTMVPRWCIQGRVIDKSAMQTFSRGGGGDGRLFSLDVMDVKGDSIRAKFWGEAADKYMPIINKGNIYTFRGGRVSVANKRYNNLSHNYEITFDVGSEILPVHEGGDSLTDTQSPNYIPHQRKCNFISLRDIKNSTRELPFIVDVLVVVHEMKGCESITSKKNGNSLQRRELKVVDSSQHVLSVTLWGEWAELADSTFDNHSVIGIQNLQIREWRGRAGQTSMNSKIIDVKSGEAESLKQWYNEHKGEASTWSSLTDLSSVGNADGVRKQAEERKLDEILNEIDTLTAEGTENDTKLFTFYGVVSSLMYKNRANEYTSLYPSCPSCKKKVVADDHRLPSSQQTAKCEGCDRIVTPEYRYMFGVAFADETCGQCIARGFHETGYEILGVRADEMNDWQRGKGGAGESEERAKVAEVFEFDGLWKQKYKVTIRVGLQSYNGETRKNVVTVALEKVDPDDLSKLMLNRIKSQWLCNATSFSESRKCKKPSPSPREDLDTPPRLFATQSTTTRASTTDSAAHSPSQVTAPPSPTSTALIDTPSQPRSEDATARPSEGVSEDEKEGREERDEIGETEGGRGGDKEGRKESGKRSCTTDIRDT